MRGNEYPAFFRTLWLVVILYLFTGVATLCGQQPAQLPSDTIIPQVTDSVPLADTLTEAIQEPQWLGPHQLTAQQYLPNIPRRSDSTSTFITIWLFIIALMIGLLKFLFPMRFMEVLRAAWEARSFSQIEREGGLINNWVSFFLFLNFLLSLSMLFYQTVTYLGYSQLIPSANAMVILIYGLILFAGYYFLKFLLMLFTGWVFKTGRPTESVMRTTLIINQFAGVAILPFLVINYYNPTPLILAGAWAIFVAMALYKIIRLSFIGLRMPGFSAYHLILYLCTIEIAPLLFIIKYTGEIVS